MDISGRIARYRGLFFPVISKYRLCYCKKYIKNGTIIWKIREAALQLVLEIKNVLCYNLWVGKDPGDFASAEYSSALGKVVCFPEGILPKRFYRLIIRIWFQLRIIKNK